MSSVSADLVRDRVSIVVRPVDAFTGTPIRTPLQVSVKGEHLIAQRNLSGYYFFTELPAGKIFDLIVSPVKNTIYLTREIVNLEAPDLGDPDDLTSSFSPVVLEVKLEPSVTFPFPSKSTLAFGTLTKTGSPDEVVAGSTIEVVGGPLVAASAKPTRTGPDGQFVLRFRFESESDEAAEGPGAMDEVFMFQLKVDGTLIDDVFHEIKETQQKGLGRIEKPV